MKVIHTENIHFTDYIVVFISTIFFLLDSLENELIDHIAVSHISFICCKLVFVLQIQCSIYCCLSADGGYTEKDILGNYTHNGEKYWKYNLTWEAVYDDENLSRKNYEKCFSYRSVVLQMEKRECFDNRPIFTPLVRLFISPIVVQSTGKKNAHFN